VAAVVATVPRPAREALFSPSVAALLRPLVGPSREILQCPGDRHYDKANRQGHQYCDAQDQVCRCLADIPALLSFDRTREVDGAVRRFYVPAPDGLPRVAGRSFFGGAARPEAVSEGRRITR
jgi:hypothetical protein